jgi:hypothetical protein
MFEPPKELTPQEKLIEHELQYGSGFQDGKFRIYEKYFADPTVNEFAEFLKHEYGTGGHSGGETEQWHDAKGLTMKLRNRQHPENEVVSNAF